MERCSCGLPHSQSLRLCVGGGGASGGSRGAGEEEADEPGVVVEERREGGDEAADQGGEATPMTRARMATGLKPLRYS